MRRTIPLLTTMALTLLVASGVALAAGVDSAAESSVVGSGESIQKAVSAADPGDTIVVRGVHREDVVIRKDGIKLRGEDGAVIEAPARARADSPCSKTFGPEAICVLGDVNIKTGKLTGSRVSDVSISGFTIRGFKIAGKGDNTAFVIDVLGARNVTVVGNRATGNVAGGIVTGRSINTTFANNDLIGNPKSNAAGINLDPDSRNTKIMKNVVRSYVFGIDGEKGTNTTIAGNHLIGNSVSGIGVFDSPGTKILSNVTRRNEVVGIFLGGTKRANAKILGNDVSGGNFGIFVGNSQEGSIAGNEAHNNCAGVVFYSDFGPPSGNFEVKGNTVEDNTRACPAQQGGEAFSGIGIGLFGARGMEVRGNHLSVNVPSGPTAVSGGVVVGVDPLFSGTTKPTDNSIVANNFGRNKPDIYFDESGTGNRFRANNCNTSIPARLCN